MKKKLLPVLLLIFLTSISFAATYTLKVTVPDSTQVVYAAGTFNNWDPTASPMNKISDAPKVFTLDIQVTDTTGSQYKFCSGPDWKYQQTDPSANFNLSQLTADGVIVNHFAVYYSSTQAKDVEIHVLVPDSIFVCYLTGTFNNWADPSKNKMTLVDSTANGKEYKLTIHTLDTTTLQFKFADGPGWPYQQTAGNFIFTTDGANVVCNDFTAYYNPANVGDITVNITVPAGTPAVYLIGSFNGWDNTNNTIKATKNADGTFTAVIPQVQTVEYKCYNQIGSWDYEEAADAAGNSLPNNRTATYKTDPVVNVTVAFWKKVFSDPNFGDITINIKVPAGTPDVYLIGSFNNWSTSLGVVKANKITDTTYKAVITFVDSIEFKCFNFPDSNYIEVADAGGSAIARRKAIFITDPTVNITVLFWKNLHATSVNNIASNPYKIYTINQNIVVENVVRSVVIYDLNGRVIESVRTNGKFISNPLNFGLYIIRIDNVQTKKIVVW